MVTTLQRGFTDTKDLRDISFTIVASSPLIRILTMRLFSSVKLAVGVVFDRTGCRIWYKLSGSLPTLR
jgi:hypothetical protein